MLRTTETRRRVQPVLSPAPSTCGEVLRAGGWVQGAPRALRPRARQYMGKQVLPWAAQSDPLPRRYESCSDLFTWCKGCSPKARLLPPPKKYPSCLKQRAIVKGNTESLTSSVQLCIHTSPFPMICQLGKDLVQCHPAHKQNPLSHLHQPCGCCSSGTTGLRSPELIKQHLQSKALESNHIMLSSTKDNVCSVLHTFVIKSLLPWMLGPPGIMEKHFSTMAFSFPIHFQSLKVEIYSFRDNPQTKQSCAFHTGTFTNCRCLRPCWRKGWHADLLGFSLWPPAPAQTIIQMKGLFALPTYQFISICVTAQARTL